MGGARALARRSGARLSGSLLFLLLRLDGSLFFSSISAAFFRCFTVLFLDQPPPPRSSSSSSTFHRLLTIGGVPWLWLWKIRLIGGARVNVAVEETRPGTRGAQEVMIRRERGRRKGRRRGHDVPSTPHRRRGSLALGRSAGPLRGLPGAPGRPPGTSPCPIDCSSTPRRLSIFGFSRKGRGPRVLF